MQIDIRPYQPQDQQGVIDLILNIQQNEFGIPITLDDQPDLRIIPDFYQQQAGNFWVAVDGDQVIGSIALIDAGDGLGALRKMFVAKDWRGAEAGIAARLLTTLLDWAREQGLTEVYLGTVDVLRAAHRFYDKSGFERVDSADIPAHFPRMKPDNIFYRIRL